MKIKTKHIITCIKCLFLGLVMALPFIAVLPTALYYGFNEHAVSGDKVEYIPTNKVETIEDIIVGNEYYQNEIDNLGLVEALTLWWQDNQFEKNLEIEAKIILVDEYYGIDEQTQTENINNNNLTIYITTEGQIVTFYKEKLNVLGYQVETVQLVGFVEMSYIMTETIKEILSYCAFAYGSNIAELVQECPQEYRTIKNIENNINQQNALEIAFNNVFNTKGFSWVSNSIIATPVYAFVGAFGLTSDLFLSNLIVYWTNILLIYAILNIVLVVFTKLTQLGKKKEED